MPSYIELYVDQGATFNHVIDISDDLTNANVDITGSIVRSQMRRSYFSANASANLTCTIADAANGRIGLSMTGDYTGDIKAGRYLFDVELTSSSGSIQRLLEGIITVTPRVTR
jgi:hypothetical protein